MKTGSLTTELVILVRCVPRLDKAVRGPRHRRLSLRVASTLSNRPCRVSNALICVNSE